MSTCYDVKSLLTELDNACDQLFISGLGVGQESTARQLAKLQAECARFGLESAEQCLSKIIQQLEQSRHSVHFDFQDLVKEFCVLNTYLALIKSKLESEIIKNTWREIPNTSA